jgi:hypothetical protein
MNRPKYQLQGRRDVVRPVVLRTITRDDFGRPRTFEVLYDEETVHLKGGEHFWVLFAPDAMFKTKTKGDA